MTSRFTSISGKKDSAPAPVLTPNPNPALTPAPTPVASAVGVSRFQSVQNNNNTAPVSQPTGVSRFQSVQNNNTAPVSQPTGVSRFQSVQNNAAPVLQQTATKPTGVSRFQSMQNNVTFAQGSTGTVSNSSDSNSVPTSAPAVRSGTSRFQSVQSSTFINIPDDSSNSNPSAISSGVPDLYENVPDDASASTHNPSLSFNFYATKKIPRKTKSVNKPEQVATSLDEFKKMMDAGCIRITGKYSGFENGKYILDIDPLFGEYINEYTDNVCVNLQKTHPQDKMTYPVDKKKLNKLRIKKLPVIADTYILGHSYEFTFSISKPWNFTNYIGITLKEE